MNSGSQSADDREQTPDSRQQRPRIGSFLGAWLAGLCVLGSLLGGIAFLPGCGKPPGLNKGEKTAPTAKPKPWEKPGKRLQKDADFTACRLALVTLNTDLISATDAVKPAELTPPAEAALTAIVPLSPDDLAEIRGSSFSGHDPAYLAECLYLRDAAHSLEVQPRPGQSAEQHAAELADLGFAWTCRQIYLNPWMMDTADGLLTMAIPPTYVLRRGYGSGLERMYVFLALLQQMGLDGCLIGAPDAGGKPAPTPIWSADKKTLLTGAARGPFWAVGVRVGNDVRLYDPWRGQVFPATLNALKANPEAQKAWFEDKANVSGVTLEDAKNATIFLAVPVNALAPRIATLEQQIKAEIGAKLAIDAAAMRNAFPDPKPAFWNPPADRFAYGRVARTFLPTEFGGSDPSPPGPNRLYERYFRQQLPITALSLPVELGNSPEIGERTLNYVSAIYGVAFLGLKSAERLELIPNSREHIQRGEFQAAASELITKQDQFSQGLERLRNNRDTEASIRRWAIEAQELYLRKGLAQTPEEKEAAELAVNNHWREHSATVQLLVDRVSAEVGQAEATVLLALCKHEQAERTQTRLERAAGTEAEQLKSDAKLAWQAALAEWRTYAERAKAQAGYPGRAAHVQLLTARAEKMAEAK